MKKINNELNNKINELKQIAWDAVEQAEDMASKQILSLTEAEIYTIKKALEELSKKPNSILNEDAEALLKELNEL